MPPNKFERRFWEGSKGFLVVVCLLVLGFLVVNYTSHHHLESTDRAAQFDALQREVHLKVKKVQADNAELKLLVEQKETVIKELEVKLALCDHKAQALHTSLVAKNEVLRDKLGVRGGAA